MGESRLHYGMSLRLYFEEKAFGPGMVMLLQEVERTGSLQKAAKAMNMAFQIRKPYRSLIPSLYLPLLSFYTVHPPKTG